MWTKIIKYQNFTRYGMHLGAKVEDSKDHKLDFLILGERKKRYIFRLDKMLLNYFSNRILINRMAYSGANFLFLTSRREYYQTIRFKADECLQTALLWRPSAIGDQNTRIEALDDLYDENDPSNRFCFEGYPIPNAFVVFDNEKFRSKRLLKETKKFWGVPLFSLIDTDSIVERRFFPIIGNDDSVMSIYFTSCFISFCIRQVKVKPQLVLHDKKENI